MGIAAREPHVKSFFPRASRGGERLLRLSVRAVMPCLSCLASVLS